MKNQQCCIFPITRYQYGYITSRLQPFNIHFYQKKWYELTILKSVQELANKKTTSGIGGIDAKKSSFIDSKNKKSPQNCIVRLRDGNYSVQLFGSGNFGPCSNKNQLIPDKFYNQCHYLRTDNNTKQIIKDWSFLGQLKQIYKRKFQIQVYRSQQIFQLQFLQLSKQNQQILLILRDNTGINLLNQPHIIDKTNRIDQQLLKSKFITHFRDIYNFLSNTCNQGNSQLMGQLPQPQSFKEGWKYKDFQGRIGEFVRGICGFCQRCNSCNVGSSVSSSGGSSGNFATNAYSTNINQILFNNYKNMYWMYRAKQIIQFTMKDIERIQQYRIAKQKQRIQKEAILRQHKLRQQQQQRRHQNLLLRMQTQQLMQQKQRIMQMGENPSKCSQDALYLQAQQMIMQQRQRQQNLQQQQAPQHQSQAQLQSQSPQQTQNQQQYPQQQQHPQQEQRNSHNNQ